MKWSPREISGSNLGSTTQTIGAGRKPLRALFI